MRFSRRECRGRRGEEVARDAGPLLLLWAADGLELKLSERKITGQPVKADLFVKFLGAAARTKRLLEVRDRTRVCFHLR